MHHRYSPFTRIGIHPAERDAAGRGLKPPWATAGYYSLLSLPPTFSQKTNMEHVAAYGARSAVPIHQRAFGAGRCRVPYLYISARLGLGRAEVPYLYTYTYIPHYGGITRALFMHLRLALPAGRYCASCSYLSLKWSESRLSGSMRPATHAKEKTKPRCFELGRARGYREAQNLTPSHTNRPRENTGWAPSPQGKYTSRSKRKVVPLR
jgi:hypothetical protein